MENQLCNIEGTRAKFLGTSKPPRSLGKLCYNFNTKDLEYISSEEYTGDEYKKGLFPLDFGYYDFGIIFIENKETLVKEYSIDDKDDRDAKELFLGLVNSVSPFEMRGDKYIYLTDTNEPAVCDSLLDVWCCNQMKYKRIQFDGRKYRIQSPARQPRKRVRFE